MGAALAAPVTLAAFAEAVAAHDLTYRYSDDARTYRRGAEQWAELRAMAAPLDPADVARIWDATVARRIAPASRTLFAWEATR